MKTSATETTEEMVARLRAEGVLDEKSIQFLIASLRPEGQVCVLPGETEEDALARLQANYGWRERTARMSLAIARGESDLVPDRPLTEEERREIELVAGDEDDVEAQEEARMISIGER
jgi:hypothetical protein